MSAVKELFSDSNVFVYAIFLIFVVIFVIKEVMQAINYICEKLGIETGSARTTKETEKRIKTLEEQNEKQFKLLQELCTNVQELKTTIAENEKERQEDIVANGRCTLYKMHNEFMAQGYTTTEGLKTFVECGKRYEKAGGNDIYHDKLYPEVMALPVEDNK